MPTTRPGYIPSSALLLALAFCACAVPLAAQDAATAAPALSSTPATGSLPPSASGTSQPLSVRGNGWVLLLDLPAGWAQDRRSLYRQGIEALFYEKGQTWKDAPAIIMIAPTSGTTAPAASVPPAASVAPAAPVALAGFVLETASFQSLAFQASTEPETGRFGYSAWLEAGKLRFKVSLLARDGAALDPALPILRSLVASLVVLEGAD
jgi:hypothetical protein